MAETCTGTFFSTAFVTSTGTGGPPAPAPFLAVELSLREQPLKTTMIASKQAVATNRARQANGTSFKFLRQIRLRVCAGGRRVNGRYCLARGDAPAASARTRYQ